MNNYIIKYNSVECIQAIHSTNKSRNLEEFKDNINKVLKTRKVYKKRCKTYE